ncbi:response regulator [bacterium]|nr:response regulator [bacterium]
MQGKILIIEDEKEFAEMVQLRLSLDGWQCDIENHTLQGIRAFLTNRYSLLILDLMVPGGGGIKVLEQRGINGLMHIPVIVLTGQTINPALEAKLRNFGVADLMIKPYDPERFQIIIKKILNLEGAAIE